MVHLPHLSVLKVAAVILAVNALTAAMDPTIVVDAVKACCLKYEFAPGDIWYAV